MNDTNCLFCKIIAGVIPCEKVYEDADTFAFLDIKPVNPGHTLVVPKEHYANMFDTPADVWGKLMQTVQKVSVAMRTGLEVENINLGMNNGSIAGQVVFHAHVHIMPRNTQDGYKLWHGKEYLEGEAKTTAEKIKKAL